MKQEVLCTLVALVTHTDVSRTEENVQTWPSSSKSLRKGT